jgi:electron transport complex protein RnfB
MLPSLVERIDDALPQTQCTRCGYADCRAYAEAIASRLAPIDRCPPGGLEGVARLAAITGDAPRPLDPAVGAEGPLRRAVIDEAACIGCTRCLPVCPVDCIVGGNKSLHVVIAPLCTGCDRCLAECPVDCIVMEPVAPERSGWSAWSPAQAATARARYAAHRSRHDTAATTREQKVERSIDPRALVDAALQRARAART